jgi:hypothetical protein
MQLATTYTDRATAAFSAGDVASGCSLAKMANTLARQATEVSEMILPDLYEAIAIRDNVISKRCSGR